MRTQLVLVPGVLFGCALLVRPAAASETILFQYPGVQNDTQFGRALANAGDVDGDGKPDVIVGGMGNGHPGRVRVYSGATGALLYDFAGLDAFEDFGSAVAGVGDVNSDGRADFAIGARWRATGAGGQGHVLVYSGLDGSLIYDLAGDAGGDVLGSAIAGVGDLNGDGVPDFAAGMPGSDLGGADAGAVRVYSGIDGSVLYERYGEHVGDSLGNAIAATGDVDGDGVGDFVVGAMYGYAGIGAGQARVYSGATGTLLWVFVGDASDDRFGTCVAGPGDLDGDGYADILVGGPENDVGGNKAGMMRVYSGATGTSLLTLYGTQANGFFGFGASGAGDIDGDGHPDVIVGAPGYSSSSHTANGRVFLYSSASGQLLDSFSGVQTNDNLGMTTALAGDLNGDGIADLLIGVPGDDAGGIHRGSARCDSAAICFTQEVCTATPNSTGVPAGVASTGPLNVSANDFTLLAQSLPQATFGYFFYSQTQALIPFGPGFRCVGGSLYRLPPVAGVNGTVTRTLDFTQPPQPGGQILPGSVWYFQCLYRDSAPQAAPFYFNLTPALKVAFCP